MIIGTMQGRLLPKYQGRYQAFPLTKWEKEFLLSGSIGLDCIEFILDYNEYAKNPLLSLKGVNRIKKVSSKTGVKVKSVCADYFMEAPLHGVSAEASQKSLKILTILIENCHLLGVSDIVIPCVDKSSFHNDDSLKSEFCNNIKKALNSAEKYGINLALETDLKPRDFLELLNEIDSNQFKANYDIGNSAALGLSVEKEFLAYGKKISSVHIKDRLLHGESVILGMGNSDFKKVFRLLKDCNFKGPFIMQAFRDDEGLEIFKKQLIWIKQYLQKYFY